jgi:hypothetical protein
MLSYILEKIDQLGMRLNISHKGNETVKTSIGGIFTICVFSFAIYSIIYFGKDIFEKKMPITRFSKSFANESKIYLEDYPMVVYFVDHSGIPIDTSGILVPDVTLYNATFDEKTQKAGFEIPKMFMEPCDPKLHYGNYDYLFTDPKNKVPQTNTICLNPKKLKETDKEITYRDDLYVMNEYAAIPGAFLNIEFFRCDSKKLKNLNLKCKSTEEIEKVTSDFYVYYFYVDYIVNLENYENPVTPYINSNVQPLSLGTSKTSLVNVKIGEIETDSGMIMMDKNSTQFYQ